MKSESFAQEQLGELELKHFLLNANLTVGESGAGDSDFYLSNSQVSFAWKYSNIISAQFSLGDLSLLGKPYWDTTTSTMGFGLFEGFGELKTGYGRLRMGLIPIEVGYEGRTRETLLEYPRSLVFQEGLVGLRSPGVSYLIGNNGFYSGFAIHHGEAGWDADNKFWYSVQWGWIGKTGFQFGLSGSTGKADIGKAGTLDFRVGNAFISFNFYGVGMVAELFLGNADPGGLLGQGIGKFVGWHIDLFHSLTKSSRIQIKYDELDKDINSVTGRAREWTYGVSFGSENRNSVLYLLGIHRMDGPPNSEFRVQWKLTSDSLTL